MEEEQSYSFKKKNLLETRLAHFNIFPSKKNDKIILNSRDWSNFSDAVEKNNPDDIDFDFCYYALKNLSWDQSRVNIKRKVWLLALYKGFSKWKKKNTTEKKDEVIEKIKELISIDHSILEYFDAASLEKNIEGQSPRNIVEAIPALKMFLHFDEKSKEKKNYIKLDDKDSKIIAQLAYYFIPLAKKETCKFFILSLFKEINSNNKAAILSSIQEEIKTISKNNNVDNDKEENNDSIPFMNMDSAMPYCAEIFLALEIIIDGFFSLVEDCFFAEVKKDADNISHIIRKGISEQSLNIAFLEERACKGKSFIDHAISLFSRNVKREQHAMRSLWAKWKAIQDKNKNSDEAEKLLKYLIDSQKIQKLNFQGENLYFVKKDNETEGLVAKVIEGCKWIGAKCTELARNACNYVAETELEDELRQFIIENLVEGKNEKGEKTVDIFFDFPQNEAEQKTEEFQDLSQGKENQEILEDNKIIEEYQEEARKIISSFEDSGQQSLKDSRSLLDELKKTYESKVKIILEKRTSSVCGLFKQQAEEYAKKAEIIKEAAEKKKESEEKQEEKIKNLNGAVWNASFDLFSELESLFSERSDNLSSVNLKVFDDFFKSQEVEDESFFDFLYSVFEECSNMTSYKNYCAADNFKNIIIEKCFKKKQFNYKKAFGIRSLDEISLVTFLARYMSYKISKQGSKEVIKRIYTKFLSLLKNKKNCSVIETAAVKEFFDIVFTSQYCNDFLFDGDGLVFSLKDLPLSLRTTIIFELLQKRESFTENQKNAICEKISEHIENGESDKRNLSSALLNFCLQKKNIDLFYVEFVKNYFNTNPQEFWAVVLSAIKNIEERNKNNEIDVRFNSFFDAMQRNFFKDLNFERLIDDSLFKKLLFVSPYSKYFSTFFVFISQEDKKDSIVKKVIPAISSLSEETRERIQNNFTLKSIEEHIALHKDRVMQTKEKQLIYAMAMCSFCFASYGCFSEDGKLKAKASETDALIHAASSSAATLDENNSEILALCEFGESFNFGTLSDDTKVPFFMTLLSAHLQGKVEGQEKFNLMNSLFDSFKEEAKVCIGRCLVSSLKNNLDTFASIGAIFQGSKLPFWLFDRENKLTSLGNTMFAAFLEYYFFNESEEKKEVNENILNSFLSYFSDKDKENSFKGKKSYFDSLIKFYQTYLNGTEKKVKNSFGSLLLREVFGCELRLDENEVGKVISSSFEDNIFFLLERNNLSDDQKKNILAGFELKEDEFFSLLQNDSYKKLFQKNLFSQYCLACYAVTHLFDSDDLGNADKKKALKELFEQAISYKIINEEAEFEVQRAQSGEVISIYPFLAFLKKKCKGNLSQILMEALNEVKSESQDRELKGAIEKILAIFEATVFTDATSFFNALQADGSVQDVNLNPYEQVQLFFKNGLHQGALQEDIKNSLKESLKKFFIKAIEKQKGDKFERNEGEEDEEESFSEGSFNDCNASRIDNGNSCVFMDVSYAEINLDDLGCVIHAFQESFQKELMKDLIRKIVDDNYNDDSTPRENFTRLEECFQCIKKNLDKDNKCNEIFTQREIIKKIFHLEDIIGFSEPIKNSSFEDYLHVCLLHFSYQDKEQAKLLKDFISDKNDLFSFITENTIEDQGVAASMVQYFLENNFDWPQEEALKKKLAEVFSLACQYKNDCSYPFLEFLENFECQNFSLVTVFALEESLEKVKKENLATEIKKKFEVRKKDFCSCCFLITDKKSKLCQRCFMKQIRWMSGVGVFFLAGGLATTCKVKNGIEKLVESFAKSTHFDTLGEKLQENFRGSFFEKMLPTTSGNKILEKLVNNKLAIASVLGGLVCAYKAKQFFFAKLEKK
jgi:hypothetical protein